jgi:hypothetical protein
MLMLQKTDTGSKYTCIRVKNESNDTKDYMTSRKVYDKDGGDNIKVAVPNYTAEVIFELLNYYSRNGYKIAHKDKSLFINGKIKSLIIESPTKYLNKPLPFPEMSEGKYEFISKELKAILYEKY